MTGLLDAARIQHHLTRLNALADMGVLDKPPREQIRKVLEDCSAALGCAYAEVCYGALDFIKVVQSAAAALPEDVGIGLHARRLQHHVLIADTRANPVSRDETVQALDLRSVLFWPLVSDERSSVLTLGWTTRHDRLSEQEIDFITFLSSVVARLLHAAERHRRLAERIDFDILTGVRNRRAILDHLAQTLSSANRTNAKVALLYIDLNGFKVVNDTHGHAVGDAALAEIARRMVSVLRKHEMAGRIGGDEFSVVVSSFSERQELEGVAARLLRALSAPMLQKGVHLSMSASVGIAVYPDDARDPAELLAKADRAMYAAKRSESGFAFYAGDYATGPAAPADPVEKPPERQAALSFQAIVDARSRRPIRAEVLARNGPAGSLLATLDALRSVSGRLAPLAMHVNVDGSDDALFELPPAHSSVALGIAEKQLLENRERYQRLFQDCRSKGYAVGIAQFGSTDLSLRRLLELPIDFVTLDARQVCADWSAKSLQTLRALVDHAHRMSSLVIAEAVHSPLEADVLQSCGVDAMQGFAFSGPLGEGDFELWMELRA